MSARPGLRRLSIGLILAIMFSTPGSGAVRAQDESAIVEVFRLSDFWVGIKITFPTEISGNFAGTLATKHFDCETVPTNVLYCMGPFRTGMDPSLLTIYDNDTGEIILQKVVDSPPGLAKGEEEPAPTEEPTPPSDDDDCSECIPQ